MTDVPPDEELLHHFVQEQLNIVDDNHKSFFRASALSNSYIKNLHEKSYLHVKQEDKAKNLFNSKGHVGLFHLFLPTSSINTFREFTNEELSKLGPSKNANTVEFMAYIGLELATSMIPLSSLADYWKTSMFTGHEDFRKVMSRNRFLQIRGKFRMKPEVQGPDRTSTRDPLHSCRSILNIVSKNFAQVAVPYGTLALDEASCRSSARNRAVSFIPNKPDPFAIRFYCIVGTAGPYLHSIWDNGKGNFSPDCQVERYNHVHPIFGPVINQHLSGNSVIAKVTASALWVCMMLHSAKLYRPIESKRVCFTDNACNRFILSNVYERS